MDGREIGGEHLWNAKGRMGERRDKTKGMVRCGWIKYTP